jgi:RNA polymerase sigma-70 factor (ECF subfamily)
MKSFFEAAIWPLRGRLYRLVFSWTKDRSLSEDLLQNVFTKTVERQEELQRHPNLSGWLVKSLKNEALMHYRKSTRTEGLSGNEEIPQSENRSLEIQEEHQLLFRVIDQLPQKQKEIFILREVEELSYEEIALQLEISLEQVKITLHRARKRVRECAINQGITP